MKSSNKIPGQVKRTSKENLKKFVTSYCNGEIFTSANINKEDFSELCSQIFLPLSFGVLSDMDKKEINAMGVFWEWIKNSATKQSIKGYPIFTSMRIMHKHDWRLAHKAILKEQKARKAKNEKAKRKKRKTTITPKV